MIKTGLVSISFRRKSITDIIKMVKNANLDAIEWGGDIHVPHGDIKKALKAYKMTRDNGLDIAAYGSYYRLGENKKDLPFQAVLDTACTLKTNLIRVWAGSIDSKDADHEYWKKAVFDAQEICSLASQHNINIATEYHASTLTDTPESTIKLLEKVDFDNFKTLWQPTHDASLEDNLESLKSLSSKLLNIHVFHWYPGYQRHLLEQGKDKWKIFLDYAKKIPGKRYALLEFFMDDSVENFKKDAITLKNILNGYK